jgi:hypothetical protein
MLRSARVASGFDKSALTGLWYEQAYIDVAQVGARCQTLNGTVRADGLLSVDFHVLYLGRLLPFTIVELYTPDTSGTRGVFVKQADEPGGSLLKLPTVVVDATPDTCAPPHHPAPLHHPNHPDMARRAPPHHPSPRDRPDMAHRSARPDMAHRSARPSRYVLYSCIQPLGIGPAVGELVVATRTKTVNASVVQDAVALAQSLGVPFNTADVSTVDHSSC